MQGINDKVRAAIFAAVTSLLTACGGDGGGSSNDSSTVIRAGGGIHLQIVSFGDSLSDVGTNSPIASALCPLI